MLKRSATFDRAITLLEGSRIDRASSNARSTHSLLRALAVLGKASAASSPPRTRHSASRIAWTTTILSSLLEFARLQEAA
jgi:hypothetical protein